MKLLWLCNVAPSAVEEKVTGRRGSGLWMDQMLEGLRALGAEVRILCPGSGRSRGVIDERCSYRIFPDCPPQDYQSEQELLFRETLKEFCPDVIHVWGTEYAHSLAMARAAAAEGQIPRMVVSLQGICSAISLHYAEGIPMKAQKQYTFRDLVRRDNILQQKRKFALRGAHEAETLTLAEHAIGRTEWDFACVHQLNPEIHYHVCGETLRQPFYDGQWRYASCRRHRIFASSCEYPVKGFHYLLEAMAQLTRRYPDVTLAVPGTDFLHLQGAARLRENSYQHYLAQLVRRFGLEGRIEFLGGLSAEQMKENYLSANVFVLPSTVENSPNSLGEAMLLGVPSVAAHVGGVCDMLQDREEGYVYQSTAPYMLAHSIGTVFDLEDRAEKLGERARLHALRTHDPKTNLRDLLKIYGEVGGTAL